MSYQSKFTGQQIDDLCDKINDLAVENILFIGSQTDYQNAFNEGKIAMGSLVIILDNEEYTSEEFSSVLGVGVLGKMILI
jgi:hypothetical protein